MARLYIANTDNAWFDFLAARPDLDEVNFWKPSAGGFSAIGAGEMFAFRLKAPRNAIAGFGVFAFAQPSPIGWAWDAFGERNGCASKDALVAAIARLRKEQDVTEFSEIGCRILIDAVFLPERLWIPVPDDWSPNIVGGKTYDAQAGEGRRVYNALLAAAEELRAPTLAAGLAEGDQARYGEPALVAPRLGQGGFRLAVAQAYGRQCAISNGKVLPALDAAHIVPFGRGGAHAVSNGILLRKDIHSVFDAGFATIDPDYCFVVSDKVRTLFNNGEEYRRLHGQRLRTPTRSELKPDTAFLRWHNENVFRG
ncbi:HNH endonuclease [Salinarimonas sp.]|uniref:HNH endonuclease n=1 Tax=Salinarimonas sp. TaxID=2766526 RepID=UPI0032D93F3F